MSEAKFCKFEPHSKTGTVENISPQQLKAQMASVKIIDVRRADEFIGELGHIKGAELITLETDLETRLSKLPKDLTYVFVCRSGGRSTNATQSAQLKSFPSVYNMQGGMLAWNALGFEVER